MIEHIEFGTLTHYEELPDGSTKAIAYRFKRGEKTGERVRVHKSIKVEDDKDILNILVDTVKLINTGKAKRIDLTLFSKGMKVDRVERTHLEPYLPDIQD